MESYRDLIIYNESKKLAIEIHLMSMTLPKHEMYEEGSQIRRCSKAITSMIVEGFARRRYKNDYIKFLISSIAECDETIIYLDFLFEAQSLKEKTLYQILRNRLVELSKKINKYTIWVEEKYVWRAS